MNNSLYCVFQSCILESISLIEAVVLWSRKSGVGYTKLMYVFYGKCLRPTIIFSLTFTIILIVLIGPCGHEWRLNELINLYSWVELISRGNQAVWARYAAKIGLVCWRAGGFWAKTRVTLHPTHANKQYSALLHSKEPLYLKRQHQ